MQMLFWYLNARQQNVIDMIWNGLPFVCPHSKHTVTWATSWRSNNDTTSDLFLEFHSHKPPQWLDNNTRGRMSSTINIQGCLFGNIYADLCITLQTWPCKNKFCVSNRRYLIKFCIEFIQLNMLWKGFILIFHMDVNFVERKNKPSFYQCIYSRIFFILIEKCGRNWCIWCIIYI